MSLSGLPAPVYDAEAVYVEKLRAAGIAVTNDPRGATPPCVLVDWRVTDDTDTDVVCGMRVSWLFVCLAPGVGNADAKLTLNRLETVVRSVLPGRARCERGLYTLSADNPSLPACTVEFDEDIPLT